MDIQEMIKKATSGEVTVEGARAAVFIQMAQFALHARPKLFAFPKDRGAQVMLDEIHDKGGVIISVDFQAGIIAAYMPKE